MKISTLIYKAHSKRRHLLSCSVLCYHPSLSSNTTSDTDFSPPSLCNLLDCSLEKSIKNTIFLFHSQCPSHHQWTEERAQSPFAAGYLNPGVLERTQSLLRNCWTAGCSCCSASESLFPSLCPARGEHPTKLDSFQYWCKNLFFCKGPPDQSSCFPTQLKPQYRS